MGTIHLQKRPTHHHHTDFWLDLHMTDWFWNWKCAQQHRHIICKIVSSYYTEHSLFNLVFLEWCFWIIFTAYLRIHLSFWIQWINKMILSSLMESLETSFSLANFICIFLYPFHKYYLVANYEFSPFGFCQISPHYCQAQVYLAVNEKIHYYYFFLQNSKNIQNKITNN